MTPNATALLIKRCLLIDSPKTRDTLHSVMDVMPHLKLTYDRGHYVHMTTYAIMQQGWSQRGETLLDHNDNEILRLEEMTETHATVTLLNYFTDVGTEYIDHEYILVLKYDPIYTTQRYQRSQDLRHEWKDINNTVARSVFFKLEAKHGYRTQAIDFTEILGVNRSNLTAMMHSNRRVRDHHLEKINAVYPIPEVNDVLAINTFGQIIEMGNNAWITASALIKR